VITKAKSSLQKVRRSKTLRKRGECEHVGLIGKGITPDSRLAQEMRKDKTVNEALPEAQSSQRKSGPWIHGQERLCPALVLTVSKFSKSAF